MLNAVLIAVLAQILILKLADSQMMTGYYKLESLRNQAQLDSVSYHTRIRCAAQALASRCGTFALMKNEIIQCIPCATTDEDVGQIFHLISSVGCMKLQMSPSYGYTGGGAFTDAAEATGPITGIKIRHGEWIDGLQFTYGTNEAPVRGGSGGGLATVFLTPGEEITSVFGAFGGGDFKQFGFTTSLGSTHGPWGDAGGTPFSYPDDANQGKLRYISGRSGDFVDALSFHFDLPC